MIGSGSLLTRDFLYILYSWSKLVIESYKPDVYADALSNLIDCLTVTSAIDASETMASHFSHYVA